MTTSSLPDGLAGLAAREAATEPTAPPQPRTWTVGDPEPEPRVTRVIDNDGDCWGRRDDEWALRNDGPSRPWTDVLRYGPVEELPEFAEIAALRAQLETVIGERDALIADRERARSASLTAMEAAALDEVDKLRAEVQRLTADYRAARDRAEAAERRVLELVDQLDAATPVRDQLTRERDEARSALEVDRGALAKETFCSCSTR